MCLNTALNVLTLFLCAAAAPALGGLPAPEPPLFCLLAEGGLFTPAATEGLARGATLLRYILDGSYLPAADDGDGVGLLAAGAETTTRNINRCRQWNSSAIIKGYVYFWAYSYSKLSYQWNMKKRCLILKKQLLRLSNTGINILSMTAEPHCIPYETIKVLKQVFKLKSF